MYLKVCYRYYMLLIGMRGEVLPAIYQKKCPVITYINCPHIEVPLMNYNEKNGTQCDAKELFYLWEINPPSS